jgi:phosphatidylserine/phosphatidylglycerophosphate/cardiolipin synthase-like enzyme
MFAEPNQDSRIIRRVTAGTEFTLASEERNENWIKARLEDGAEGWVMAQDMEVVESAVRKIEVSRGFGYRGSYWQLFFTSPQPEGAQPNEYGIDARFADAVGRCRDSLDISALYLSSRMVTDAIIEAHRRGVVVRVVTDGDSLTTFKGQTFSELQRQGIPVRTDGDARGRLMTSQFSVLDNQTVWAGSWYYTDMSTYKNNDNALVLDSPEVAAVYAAKFNLMFEQGQFWRPRGGGDAAAASATPASLPNGVRVYFTPDDDPLEVVRSVLGGAKSSIRFMTMGFNQEAVAEVLVERAQGGVQVQGIFEESFNGERTSGWKLMTGNVSNMEVRKDGNPNFLHHNCIMVDDSLVLTGSLPLTPAGMRKNVGNMIVLTEPSLVARYRAEFQRLWNVAKRSESAD